MIFYVFDFYPKINMTDLPSCGHLKSRSSFAFPGFLIILTLLFMYKSEDKGTLGCLLQKSSKFYDVFLLVDLNALGTLIILIGRFNELIVIYRRIILLTSL